MGLILVSSLSILYKCINSSTSNLKTNSKQVKRAPSSDSITIMKTQRHTDCGKQLKKQEATTGSNANEYDNNLILLDSGVIEKVESISNSPRLIPPHPLTITYPHVQFHRPIQLIILYIFCSYLYLNVFVLTKIQIFVS